MMKRITALVLVLALVCSLSTAFAWSCPSCGNEMGGNFCTECGTKKPENICPSCGTNFGDKALNFCTECGTKMTGASPTAAPAATPAPEVEAPSISYASQTGSGAIGILWSPREGATYTVEYVLRQSDDPWADSAANGGFHVVSKTADAGLDTNSRIVPGADYWIGLFDEEGRGHYAPFEADPTGTFSDFECTVIGWPQRVIDGEELGVRALSLEEINSGMKVGLYLAMDYDNPGEEKEYTLHVVLEAPNGSRWPKAAKATFKAESSSLAGWSFFDLTEYFAALKAGFGKVEAGDYKVTLYLDLDLIGTVPFQVQEEAVPTAEPKADTAATAEPTAAPEKNTPKIADLITNENSTLTVTWTGGEAPYTVRYAEKRTDDYYADLEDPTSFGSWTSTTECEETSYQLNRLVPGRPYWIVVVDQNGDGQYISYTPEAAGAFDDFAVSLSASPRSQEGESKTDIAFIPTDLAGLETDAVSYGGQIFINYDNPGAEREMLYQLALTLPNGAVRVEKFGNAILESGTDKWLGWNFCDLESYFERVLANFDAIPEGDLIVDFYLDGKLAGTATMPMKASKPLNITGVTDNGDGTHLLTWEDNGNGPYTVYYHERFSEDSEADRRDERGSGRWIEEEDIAANSIRLEHFIPGKSYWITLKDSAGAETITSYSLSAPADAGMNMTIEASPRREKDEAYTDMKGFSAAALNQEYEGSYGLYIGLQYNPIPEDTKKASMWVLTTPEGVSFCEYSFNMNLFADGLTYWDFYNLDWAIKTMKGWYGGVPEGEYRFDLYVEGAHAGGTTFYVGQ